MPQKKLSLILFDFHNVLSKSYFYTTIIDSHAGVYEKIMQALFSQEAYPLLSRWMRGELSYKDIHKKIAATVGMSASSLDEVLIKSVKKIVLNNQLLEFSRKMRSFGVKIAILTDNFDVFEEVYVPYAGLDIKFDRIFSSHNQKKLKLDNDAELVFDAILAMESKPENTLFIDDSIDNGKLFKNAGGIFYQYDRYIDGHNDFIKWFCDSFPFFANKIN